MIGTRQRILIIDDTPANIQVLHELFREEYETFFATSGAEGVQVALREIPDIILLDIMMPEMNGYEACKLLKSDGTTAAIPVIFVTAMGEEEDEAMGLEAGAIDYLTKPVSPPIVKARVRNHLELKRIRDSLEQTGRELAAKNVTLEKEKALAHRILESILPQRLNLPGFDTAVVYRPSDQIGGDFFDAWDDGEYTHFIIGDISGHSISAALVMAVCKGLFMPLSRGKIDPGEIVTAANGILSRMLMESGMYLTMVYLVCERNNGSVKMVSAGHNPVYFLGSGGTRSIDSTGPPVGWDPEDRWEVVECPFSAGDTILLYTDGLTEATDSSGEPFGNDALLAQDGTGSPDEMVKMVFRSVETFCNGTFDDDVTIFAIGRR